jgi:hypothetical protein
MTLKSKVPKKIITISNGKSEQKRENNSAVTIAHNWSTLAQFNAICVCVVI